MSDGLLMLGRRSPPTSSRVALLQSGFRPFFLLAPVTAALAIVGWIVVLRGVLLVFALAFLLFLGSYFVVLVRPRPDGAPG